MAIIQSKNIIDLNQIKLRNRHKISEKKTVLELEKNKKLYKKV